jgi:hypothetical protein
MKQSETRKLWEENILPKAAEMIKGGRSLPHAAASLKVVYSTLLFHYKRFYGEEVCKISSEGKVFRYLPYLTMSEDGKSIKEISLHFKRSKEWVRQILMLFGVDADTIKGKSLLNKQEDANKLFDQVVLKKRKAFRLGLSIAEYEKYVQKVPKDIRANISNKIGYISRNEGIVKTLRDGLPFMQLSALEILEMYLKRARDFYPDENTLSCVRRMLAPKSGYAVIRRDFSMPYLPENSFVATKSEFGSVWGKQFGAHSDYQQKRKVGA